MEQVDLTAPITAPAINTFKVVQILLSYDPDLPADAHIRITLKGTNGEKYPFDYTGATAETLIVSLNKVDLSVKSLHRRIMERLIADGKLAGTISGTP